MGKLTSKIRFSQLQWEILEQLSRQRTISKQLSERVEILLLTRSGFGIELTARRMGLRKGKVVTWRNRWIAAQDSLDALEAGCDVKRLREAVVAVLSDLRRAGRPQTFTQAQRELIVALACEPPADHGLQQEAWTHEALALKAKDKQLVEGISPATVWRILKK